MKALKPSMREKKRYLLVQGKISEIEKAILEGIGTIGISRVGLSWIKSGKESAVISVNRNAVDSVRACFALWPEKIWVSKVSGTIKGLNR